jgi:hypothetical protein
MAPLAELSLVKVVWRGCSFRVVNWLETLVPVGKTSRGMRWSAVKWDKTDSLKKWII